MPQRIIYFNNKASEGFGRALAIECASNDELDPFFT
jgi:hypothetical protein